MKKILSLGLATAMVVGTLAGCGGNKPAETAAAPETTTAAATDAAKAPETTAEGETTNIVWWAFPTFGVDTGYEQEVVDAFTAKNPDINVKVEYIDFTSGPDKLTAALTSGTAPDILFDAPGRIIEFGEAGYLVPLDDMLDELKSDLTSQSLVETCACEREVAAGTVASQVHAAAMESVFRVGSESTQYLHAVFDIVRVCCFRRQPVIDRDGDCA